MIYGNLKALDYFINYIDKEKSVGILTTKENSSKYPKGKVVILGEENNLEEIASNLFNALREFNDLGVDIILAEAFNEEGIGVAIMNRLNKAAGYDIIDV